MTVFIRGMSWALERLLHNQSALRLKGPVAVHARRDGDFGALAAASGRQDVTDTVT